MKGLAVVLSLIVLFMLIGLAVPEGLSQIDQSVVSGEFASFGVILFLVMGIVMYGVKATNL